MWSWRRAKRPRARVFRAERWGGIVHLERPRALVFVDRERARALGYEGGAAWRGEESLDGVLTGPLEAHLQLTNRCQAGCQGCYTGASPTGAPGEWGEAEWRRAIDALAARGVFHLALGGGESALLPWLGDVARHARERGMVPNLTTSGLYDEDVLERLVGWAPLFGQINVSVDGVGDRYREVRGFDGFARAERAVIALRRATRHVGVNCVVTRASFDGLDELFAWARRRRLNEVELLRFKPSGRGAGVYESLRCTDAQHRAIVPTVLGLARKHRMRVRLDCSYTPMVAHWGVRPELLRFLAIYGCAGGDLLVGAKATGALTACSFAAPIEVKVDGIGEYWERGEAFGPFRRWREAAEEPCRSCAALALCRGGCRVVAAHVAGSAAAPDPECPRVIDQGGTFPSPLVGQSPTSLPPPRAARASESGAGTGAGAAVRRRLPVV